LQKFFKIPLLCRRIVDDVEQFASVFLVRGCFGNDKESATSDGCMGGRRDEIETDHWQEAGIAVGNLRDDPGAVDHERRLAFGEYRANRIGVEALW
jgi:hypothetical protein